MSTPATPATAADAKEKGGTSGHLARAVALHLAGKREEAVKQLQSASASGKAPAEVYRAMGHIQFELEDFQQAEKSYRALVRLKPQYAMGWFNLAVCLERLGNWDQALEAFHKACSLEPSHLDAHLGLAIAHLRLEDPKSALFSFERCLELHAGHEDALFGKAVALQSLGHADDAAEIFQRLLESNPESEEALSNLILIGMSKEDFDMVREYSERLLDMRPGFHGRAGRAGRLVRRRPRARAHRQVLHAAGLGRARTFRGLVQSRPGSPESRPPRTGRRSLRRGPQAAAAIRRSLHQPGNRARTARRPRPGPARLMKRPCRLAPNRSRPSGTWGFCWNTPGNWKRPSVGTSRCWSKAPKEEEARFRLGYLRLQREDYRGAIEAFEGCLKHRPQWPEAQANLALAYGGLGERENAERLYEKMLDSDPKSLDALRGLAALAVQASDFDAALEHHVRLIDLGEKSPEVLYNAGLMYEKAGQLEKAVELYREALEQHPDMPEALLNLGRILESTGKADEARVCWSKGSGSRAGSGARLLRTGYRLRVNVSVICYQCSVQPWQLTTDRSLLIDLFRATDKCLHDLGAAFDAFRPAIVRIPDAGVQALSTLTALARV